MRALSLLLLVGLLSGASASKASALPAWARRYNVNCSHCHAPAVPRLNATGIRFRWAGYRMPEDIGQAVSVEKVQNYIALRGRMSYAYAKTAGQPASENAFGAPDATIFYAGPFGKNFGAFFEIERGAPDDVGLTAQFMGVWGTERNHGGFRAGQIHWGLESGLAGFDRATGISEAIPVDDRVTAGIPFSFGAHQLGAEAFYVTGRNRIGLMVLNGFDPTGAGDMGDQDTKKDFVLTEQYLMDEAGSGITGIGYYGTMVGADPLAPTTTSHYWRMGLSANKFIKNCEVSGTVVYGKDSDLPVVGGGAFATPKINGLGYFLYGGYTFLKGTDHETSGTPLTLFGRYEYADQNTDVSNDANRRFVAGGVLPVTLPEYLRLALEYTLDTPQGGGPKQHGLAAEMMLNF